MGLKTVSVIGPPSTQELFAKSNSLKNIMSVKSVLFVEFPLSDT